MPDAYLDSLSYANSERFWQGILARSDGGCVFVAEDEGGIFGFASGWPREDFSRGLREYVGELNTIYVLRSRQGAHAGRRLIAAVAKYFVGTGIGSMLLWVFTENNAARQFYESLGGILVAEDAFEIGGVWVIEVAYGWRDLGVLLIDE